VQDKSNNEAEAYSTLMPEGLVGISGVGDVEVSDLPPPAVLDRRTATLAM
jgi:hypothetical protein